MEFLPREEVIQQLQRPFQSLMDQYDIDDIGIFEEEGEENRYFLGYNVKKSGKTYHIHMPYQKNHYGELAPLRNEWILETDEPAKDDQRGFQTLEGVLRKL